MKRLLDRSTLPACGGAALAVVWLAVSCSVFPDHAVLPGGSASVAGHAGEGGESAAGGSGGSAATSGGSSGVAGVTGAAGAQGVAGSSGGRGGQSGAGEGGQGGAPDCSRETVVVPVTADTWIDEGHQSSQHGSEETLLVSGAPDERRALLAFSVPDPGSKVIARAVLILELVANHDLTRSERTLRVFPLSGGFDEASANWRRRRSGSGDASWVTNGGDVGNESAISVLPQGTAAGPVSFEMTALMAAAELSGELPAFLVLESSAPPPAPAELEFGARESLGPSARLELEYCEP